MLVQVSSGILPYSHALDSTFFFNFFFLLHHRIIKLDTQIEFLALGAIDASLGGGINVLIRWRCGECAIRLVIFIVRCMVGFRLYQAKCTVRFIILQRAFFTSVRLKPHQKTH